MITVSTAVSFLIRVAIFAWYARDEHRFARYLPWWRRYLTCLPMSVWVVNGLEVFATREGRLDWALTLVSIGLHAWNMASGRRNKRNGKDFKTKEAAEAELTEVQQQSFNQQVAEAS